MPRLVRASGSSLTEDSLGAGSVACWRHAQRDRDRGERCGSWLGWRRSWRIATARRSTSGGRGSSWLTADGLRHGRDHAPGRGVPSRRSGAGRSGSCRRAWTACCATRPASRACRRLPTADGRPGGRADAAPSRPARRPTGPAARWPTASGVSLRSVQRIWAAHGLQPHRVRRFKLSTDPGVRRQARATWSACTSIRRRTAWCCRSTRSRHVWMAPGSQEKS